MRKLIDDYKEFTLMLDRVPVVFFINSGLRLNGRPVTTPYMHSHYHCEIFCVFGGEMELETQEGLYKLQAGDSIIIPRDVMHKSSYSEDVFRISLAFSVPTSENRATKIASRLRSVSESERAIIIKNSLISEPVKRIVHYLYGSFDYRDELIRGCLTELVALICQGECEYTNLQKTNDSRNYRQYLVQSYFTLPPSGGYDSLTLDELSRNLNLSHKQAQRTVKSVFGRTFKEQIVFLKMNRAAELLGTTNMTVNEIAAYLGYNGTRSFFSAFKAAHGMTPRQYRKSIKKEG
jgi:AraC-like DNA-binding protein